MTDRVYRLAIELKPFEAEQEVKTLLSAEVNPDEILMSLRKAMMDACKKYDAGEFSLPHLTAMTTTFSMGYELIKDKVRKGEKGKILMGTLGSMHYIGKDIIKFLLMADGFEVCDLGENLLAENFMNGMREFNPDIIGVSVFLTNAILELGKIVEYIEKHDLRDKVKIIIGGVQANPKIAEKFKVDGWARDPGTAVSLTNELINELRKRHG